MIHAEASNFPSHLSKHDTYARLYTEAEALFSANTNADGKRGLGQVSFFISQTPQRLTSKTPSNLANTASLLYHALKSLPAPSNRVNWVGFYTLDPSSARDGRDAQLILGPFMGKVACQSIRFGKGVCGTAAAEMRTVRVDDVDEFPGHIACDANSKSEIVVPIVVRGHSPSGSEEGDVVVAVIDIDCSTENGFDETDEEGLG
ncbi:MAG: hypothetical protein LQ346_002721 [Caloplaca aetnensis]|nr:MAG: hypothetical protein LQ346_002721 [Caloplaca aetnensis]